MNNNNDSVSSFIDQICLLNKCQVGALVNAIALMISQDRTPDEINLIKDFISAISSNLSLIARRESFCADKKNDEEMDSIKKKISELENKSKEKK